MFDKRGEDLPVARLGFRAHQVDDTLCEIRVELALLMGIALGITLSADRDVWLLHATSLEDSLAVGHSAESPEGG
jgi:hypothetical protein